MLWKLRVLVFYFFLTLFTVTYCSLIFTPVSFLLHRAKGKLLKASTTYSLRYKLAEIFSIIFIQITRLFAGISYRVEGLELLPDRPSLVLSNHQSFWENVFMQIIIPKHSWVIKKELFNIPFFGWGLRSMEPIAVDRSQSRSVAQIIKNGTQKLQNDHWIIMFPEATRLKPRQTRKFKPSAAALALEAGVPIVLMAHNAGLFWPKAFWLRKPGTVSVKIIKVITPEEAKEFDARSLTDHIEQIINHEKENLLKVREV